MEPAVAAYVDAIPTEHRPLFDRVHGLIVGAFPDVAVRISYDMPTYVVGDRRLHVAAWRHGVSFYGWSEERDGGFTERHPDLVSGKGTIRLPTKAADDVGDDELTALITGALG